MKLFPILTLCLMAVCCLTIPEHLQAQPLTYQGAMEDGVGGLDGLISITGIVVSPDNKHAYVIEAGGNRCISAFSRNVSGQFTFLEKHCDDAPFFGGLIEGLVGPNILAISPDGKSIYIPTQGDNSLVVFSRDTASGLLTWVETHYDGVGGVDGLTGGFKALVSHDNQHVYVTAYAEDALAVFERNTSTGALTFLEVHHNGVNGVNGIDDVRGLVLSADGKHIYTAGNNLANAIAVFSRNEVTGLLTYVASYEDDAGSIDGMAELRDVAVSPDGRHVYGICSTEDAISVFSRDSTDGTLTFITFYEDDSWGGPLSYLDGGWAIKVSCNGQYVFATAIWDDGLTVLERDPVTGLLTQVQGFTDGVGGVDKLDYVRTFCISPDGLHLYVGSLTEDAISIFDATGLNNGVSLFDSLTISPCDSVFLQGGWQNVSGTYIDALSSPSGCSIIKQTLLTVDSSYITVYDTVDLYDTTYVTVNDTLVVLDTTKVTLYDTLTTLDTIPFYDSTFVMVYDTVTALDTIPFNDTTLVMVYDTITTLDTIPFNDTTHVTLHDTITTWDTTSINVFDTTWVTIWDTLVVYDTISVTDTLIIVVDLPSGIPPDDENMLMFFPNPTNDKLIIYTGNYGLMDDYNLKIVNTSGQQIFSSLIDQQMFTIDMTQFGAKGLYYIQVFDANQQLIVIRKIVLQ